MRDLITWAKLTRLYLRRGWSLRAAVSHAHTLVYAGAFRP